MIDTIQSELLHSRPSAFRSQPAVADNHAQRRQGATGLGARRDVLDLPAQFRPSPPEEGGEGGEVDRGRNGSALEGFRGLVQSALNAIRHDLGQVLKGLGFDSKAANQFAKSFIEPVVDAIKEGVSFTAKLSFAALAQVTETTATSFRQSTSLVARSFEISVNRETGEVSLSLASLRFEEDISAVTGGTDGGEPPLLTLGPGPLVLPPQEAGGVMGNPLEPLLNALPPAPENEANGETEPDPAALLLADLRDNLIESAFSFQAIIAIQLISFTTNEANQPITTILFDVALPLNRLEFGQPESPDTVPYTVDVTA